MKHATGRTERFQLMLTPEERAALADLAARDGVDKADVIRRLLNEERRRAENSAPRPMV
jgi:hypothetical protein